MEAGNRSIWSVRHFYIYLVLFAIPVLTTLVNVVDGAVDTKGLTYPAIVTIGQKMSPVVITSAGLSLILAEGVSPFIMLAEWLFRKYVEPGLEKAKAERQEALRERGWEQGREQGREEVLLELEQEGHITEDQRLEKLARGRGNGQTKSD